jgi:hypothetical protein
MMKRPVSLLTDGGVLIVGGGAWNSPKNQPAPTDSAEIYTP